VRSVSENKISANKRKRAYAKSWEITGRTNRAYNIAFKVVVKMAVSGDPNELMALLDKYTEIVEHRIRTNGSVIELMHLTPFFVLSEKRIYSILFEVSAIMITFIDICFCQKSMGLRAKIMNPIVDYFCSHYSINGFRHDDTLSIEDLLYDRFDYYAATIHNEYIPCGHWMLNPDASRANDSNSNLLLLLGDYIYSAFFFEKMSSGSQLKYLTYVDNPLELIPFNAIIFEGIRPSFREFLSCLK